MSLTENENKGSSPASQDEFNYGENDRQQTPRHADKTAAEFDKKSDKADDAKREEKENEEGQRS